MKSFALMLSLLFTSLCNGQAYRFRLYRTAACKTTSYLDTDYALYKIPGSIDTDYMPKAGTVYLPGPGRYGLVLNNAPHIDTVFEIRDTGLFVFNYKEPDVGLYYDGNIVDEVPRYKNCDLELQGYFECKYPNGNLRIKGDFINGLAKDSLLFFYDNGQLKSRWRHLRSYAIAEKFDSTGNKVKIFTRENGSFMTYHWRKIIEFFPNGKVKFVASDVDHIRLIKEYYANGQIKIDQTKRHRYEYAENGTRLLSFIWKTKRSELGEKHEKDFTVKEKVYIPSGEMVMSIVYSCENELTYPPPLKPNKADEIDSITIFKDSRVASKISDISTEKYINQFSSFADGSDDEDW